MSVTRDLIYPKGAYVLHMVRMMMWDRHTGDQNFKATMQDFVKTFAGRAATTEDFKAMVEKHMTHGNGSGSAIGRWTGSSISTFTGPRCPRTSLTTRSITEPTASCRLTSQVTQSNVDEHFRMLVPIYLELADGRVVVLGRARLAGSSSVATKVPSEGNERPAATRTAELLRRRAGVTIKKTVRKKVGELWLPLLLA